jgi:hypothetical protein
LRIIDPGHKFGLRNLDGDGEEILTFVKRDGEGYPGNVGHYEGTNIQEVIRALIARVQYLDLQVPCSENKVIVSRLRDCIRLLEIRAAKRHKRTYPDALLHSRGAVEAMATCNLCGHVACAGTCRAAKEGTA